MKSLQLSTDRQVMLSSRSIFLCVLYHVVVKLLENPSFGSMIFPAVNLHFEKVDFPATFDDTSW